jgi:hypothetical protein
MDQVLHSLGKLEVIDGEWAIQCCGRPLLVKGFGPVTDRSTSALCGRYVLVERYTGKFVEFENGQGE